MQEAGHDPAIQEGRVCPPRGWLDFRPLSGRANQCRVHFLALSESFGVVWAPFRV
jgi:23S rRNA-/tRNA-specific pseudouridylate synthase